MNPLRALPRYGQSVWLDYLERGFILNGELDRLIHDDGLRGLTSNPAIFEKAMVEGGAYEPAMRDQATRQPSAEALYEALALDDIRAAADRLRPVYDELDGTDGFVSLEVEPNLALDTQASLDRARHLWTALDRPNVCIKIPATVEGLPVIETLTAEGINVNVTLLFGLPRYRAVAEAYIRGLERRQQAGQPIDRIASFASFFLSRIDVAVEPLLRERAAARRELADRTAALEGTIAIASAKVAYRIYQETFHGPRFAALANAGARTQRLLWASTGTKVATDSDTKYIEPLIGPETVTTMPPKTLEAYRDHGRPAARLEDDVETAERQLAELAAVGVSLDDVTRHLEEDGIAKFQKPFDRLLSLLGNRLARAHGDGYQQARA